MPFKVLVPVSTLFIAGLGIFAWLVILIVSHQGELDKKHKFTLQDGSIVTCRAQSFNCGMDLWDCDNGHRYFCQDNVVRAD